METNVSLDDILSKLPLNKTILFDDISVCLQMFSEGSLLSAELSKKYSTSIISSFLESAFEMALLFDAGLAIDERNNTLLITQWLPSVKSWIEAEAALEKILNQLDNCHSVILLSKDSIQASSLPSKGEQRIRSLLGR